MSCRCCRSSSWAAAARKQTGRQARRRPYLVVLGLTLSFAVFTLFGSLILASLHLPDDAIRWLGLALLLLVGLGLLVPSLGHLIERPFYRFPQRALGTGRNGFLLGIALGAVFVPCAGPVLAAITVAGAAGHIGLHTVGLTLGFAVGTAIPLLAFALAGRGLTQRLGAFRRHQGAFRTVSGVVIIVLAVALTFNLSDIVQRDIPNYTQAAGNSLEKGATKAQGSSGSLSLQDCQTAAEYGGSGLEECGPAPAFSGIQQWLNTPGGQPLTLASVKGKVVIVDFWAYSCINCQRELPHVEAWAKNYAADGLEVVGVHTPEYAFEHVPSNVAAGARRLGLTFPIALDNSYDTWNAYDNQSWPAAYIIDAQGQIRHVSIGEGDYASEEQLIRQLLVAAHPGPDPAGRDRCPRHHPRQSGADTGDLPGRRTPAALRRQHQLLRRPAPVRADRLPADGFLHPVRHLDHRGRVDHGRRWRRDHAGLQRLVCLPRRRRHRHPDRLLRRDSQDHPGLRRPRHLYRGQPAVPAGRHRDRPALTGAAGLLLHLRLRPSAEVKELLVEAAETASGIGEVDLKDPVTLAPGLVVAAHDGGVARRNVGLDVGAIDLLVREFPDQMAGVHVPGDHPA